MISRSIFPADKISVTIKLTTLQLFKVGGSFVRSPGRNIFHFQNRIASKFKRINWIKLMESILWYPIQSLPPIKYRLQSNRQRCSYSKLAVCVAVAGKMAPGPFNPAHNFLFTQFRITATCSLISNLLFISVIHWTPFTTRLQLQLFKIGRSLDSPPRSITNIFQLFPSLPV